MRRNNVNGNVHNAGKMTALQRHEIQFKIRQGRHLSKHIVRCVGRCQPPGLLIDSSERSNNIVSRSLNKRKKASSYIVQYPVLRTVQGALYFTSLTDLFTQTPSLGNIQPYATINARRLLVHISTPVYSQVPIYTAE